MFNVDGVEAKLKTNNSSRHATYNRPTYYCGRNVGQAGYYNPCGRCDGRVRTYAESII